VAVTSVELPQPGNHNGGYGATKGVMTNLPFAKQLYLFKLWLMFTDIDLC